ncbi:hypothetical protein MIDIC_510004 [Alphaproteobacteria bacterium]
MPPNNQDADPHYSSNIILYPHNKIAVSNSHEIGHFLFDKIFFAAQAPHENFTIGFHLLPYFFLISSSTSPAIDPVSTILYDDIILSPICFESLSYM